MSRMQEALQDPEYARLYVDQFVRAALLEEMRDQQYFESAIFKAQVDALKQFLVLALPAMPSPVSQNDGVRWVRAMLTPLAQRAEEEEARMWFLKEEMNRPVGRVFEQRYRTASDE